MKTGIAFSGSGTGAAVAHHFLDELQKSAIKAEMLSVTSLAAVPAMLWAHGLSVVEADELMTLFERAHTPECALRQFQNMGLYQHPSACGLAVNCVDTITGVSVIFSDTLRSEAWNLKVLPLSGHETAAFASAVSPHESGPYPYNGMRLCDFAIRCGCPFFPLKMAGMERILSVSFAGGEEPARIASDSLAVLTGHKADLHYTVSLFGAKNAGEQVRVFVREHIQELYEKLLF